VRHTDPLNRQEEQWNVIFKVKAVFTDVRRKCLRNVKKNF